MRKTYRARRRTTRRRSSTFYTVETLLQRQPKSLASTSTYPAMMRAVQQTPGLLRVRFPRRCYTLLHNATITPENLPNLFRTYRLPNNEFFPLFLAARREYLRRREERSAARERYAIEVLRALPIHRLGAVKYLGTLECSLHPQQDCPVWNRSLFPSSRRAADRYARFDRDDWQRLFGTHVRRLCERYRAFSPMVGERVMAHLILEMVPAGVPPVPPRAAELAGAYRRLSLEHHPDRGGDAARFIELKRARDLLAGGW